MSEYLTRVAEDDTVMPCPHCNGDGIEPGERDDCSMCEGTGIDEEDE